MNNNIPSNILDYNLFVEKYRNNKAESDCTKVNPILKATNIDNLTETRLKSVYTINPENKKQIEGFIDVDTRCKYCGPNQNNINVNGEIKQCDYPLTNINNECVCDNQLYKNIIDETGKSICTLNLPSIN
jgi:hypothetical protein